MFLELSHTRLDIYHVSKKLVIDCYRCSERFPQGEKYALTRQIRRAAISVHLNIAEGCSRKSVTERKRFYEISRGSLVEIDAAFDIAVELDYINKAALNESGKLMIRIFQMLSKMINA
jgi:four helix bundle protein